MKRFKLMLSAAVLVAACSATAMAGTPKGETKDVKSETKIEAKSEVKDALYYWFDDEGHYLNPDNNPVESVGCQDTDGELCAKGYSSVSNPNNPQEPTTAPAITRNGPRP